MEVLPISSWLPNLTKPLVIAGPCSAETEEQVLSTAYALAKQEGVRVFRAGIWKPRTRPNCFEGVGEKGLRWLRRVKDETGLFVTTEVANAQHVELALENGIDILWIGARTTVNPFSVQEIADALRGTNVPVMVKNPINADLALWVGAMERINQAGINKMIAIHRGFSSADCTKYRNNPNWRVPMELKRLFPELPIICDPSHITGKREMISKVSQKAMDVDMDGLMVETHLNPDTAWSDAAQQVTPTALAKILNSIMPKTEFSLDREFEYELNELRQQIDRIDSELMENLRVRFNLVEKIGELKRKNSVTALQRHRMDEVHNRIMNLAKQVGLREKFAHEVFNIIHEESVKCQTELMTSNKKL